MLTVNCAAIPRDLIESQLFGHKKGSFTGADSDHIGWFQQSHTGTLFLDEIGELTLEGQAKLLRILEGHPFLPVGATEEVLVDVRVIAATNRDLAEFVRERKFREDLFYRLSVFELFVPPLRDREGDIELLVNHFLEHFRRQHGRADLGISDAAKQKLLDYPWPGNVRELRNLMERLAYLTQGDTVDVDDLAFILSPDRDASSGISMEHSLTEATRQFQADYIRKHIESAGGNMSDAARRMGLHRSNLYRKMRQLGMGDVAGDEEE